MSTGSLYSLFASTPKGAEPALARELAALGAQAVNRIAAGATFRGDLTTAYRVCLWSRAASRVYLNLENFRIESADDIYDGVKNLPWEDHLPDGGTLAVSFKGMGQGIRHTGFGAQRVKDAVVDRLRDLKGTRPSVDLDRPDLQISAVLRNGSVSLGLDLVGRPLHQRGYRVRSVPAPLKENLAAAMLMQAEWPRLANADAPLVDPLCGSGTLLIEGAMMAADVAPALLREGFAFETWLGHEPDRWRALLDEARERCAAGAGGRLRIYGGDADGAAVEATLVNAAQAGFADRIRVERVELKDFEPGEDGPGLLITNPPYGHRLSRGESRVVYGELERCLERRFAAWQVAVMFPDDIRGGLDIRRRCRQRSLYNGPLACRLQSCGPETRTVTLGPDAEMLANRLRKNRRHLGRWAARGDIGCYRVYDADLPEYAFAVDLYEGDRAWVHVQEYTPPDSVDPKAALRRRREAEQVIAEVFEVTRDRLFFKSRRRQKGKEQYPRLDRQDVFHEVQEAGHRFLVNFTDYLDTGLFLDHRLVRARVGELAAGRRFLNLFAYTGTATVYAAAGGAVETTTVDLSARYLDWARRNLELNGFSGASHRLVVADCLEWIEGAIRAPARYDLIYVDPPTFSNSKKMQSDWDVQRGHESLLRRAVSLLIPGGIILFSTNARRFRLSESLQRDMVCKDFTKASLPEDFRRNPRIHQCWEIRAS